jgi:pilus assembly protein TadC
MDAVDVLKDVQDLLRKYSSLGTKKGRIWDRMRWGLKDIRRRLTVNVSMLPTQA